MDNSDFLRFHGDVDAAGAWLDFAVNVRSQHPPDWLVSALAAELTNLGSYPSEEMARRATAAVAGVHGVPVSHVLLLAGAAEGFSLLPHLLADQPPKPAVVVHPSFTEPEYALRAAGIPVERLLLDAPFTLPPGFPSRVAGASMVVVGNPTNPTGVLHDPGVLRRVREPLLVVDEAFMDVVGEECSLVPAVVEQPNLIVLRSLTKTWALAGLRCGYVVAQPHILARLAARRPHWPLGSVQLRAFVEVASRGVPVAVRAEVAAQRVEMVTALGECGFRLVAQSQAPFVLVQPPDPDPEAVRRRLLARGVAVRRCDTFPGLDQRFWRLAVRDMDAVRHLLEEYCS